MSDRRLLPPSEIPAASPRTMQLYGRFWDIMSLLIFGGAALNVIVTHREALTWQHWVAAGLTAAQGGLYLVAIALRGWPIPRRWLALYFVGGITLWLSVGLLQPEMWWVGMTYFGQMFGLLPPRATIFGTLLINLLVILQITRWNPANAPPGLLLGFAFQWAGGMAVYLFITKIISTSQERGHLVARLEAAQRELEAARQKEVELALLRERERLARDLHDSLGHALVAISVQLEAIQRLYRVDPQRGSDMVDELKHVTRRSLDDLRRSLAGLRAPGLGERRLTEALQTLSMEVGQRAGLTIDCRLAPEADGLSLALAETLWRTAQESLTNIEKHARARHVQVTLSVRPEAAVLRVADDGVGLPPDAETRPNHFGLHGLRERVEGLGGRLSLTSDGAGTVVQAELPIIASEMVPWVP